MQASRTRLTKKPLTVGLELELYRQVRDRALSKLAQYESMTGAVQRWIVEAIKAKLDQGATPPREEVLAPDPMPPGSLAEARYQITRLRAIESKPGQYPPVRARAQREREAWEDELMQRQKKAAIGRGELIESGISPEQYAQLPSDEVEEIVGNVVKESILEHRSPEASVEHTGHDDYAGDDIV